MSKRIGLTDDPKTSRSKHGNPPDWWQTPFRSQAAARAWKGDMLTISGYRATPGASGWRYGYTFTLSS